jgi:hypothetical protein
VAQAFLACKPSSGGLECDFGALKDILASKRASLGQGLVEAEMMLKLNKHLFLSNPELVVKLPAATWPEHIPKRPTFPGDTDDEDNTDEEPQYLQTEVLDIAHLDDTNQGGDEVGGDEAVVIESSVQAERDRFDNSTDEEGDDEHTGTIISCTPGYADTQLSTFPVFDSQETCDMC